MKLKGMFGNLFKNVQMGNFGRTLLIVGTTLFVLAVVIYVFFF